MAFIPKAELANFVCKFGEKNLVDYLAEIVIPAFASGSIRKYGDTQWRLHQTSLWERTVDGEVLHGIKGRLVKIAKLERDQVFDEETKELIKDHKEMPTAPSSAFLLTFHDHKLFYCREVADAPSVDEFRSTMANLLRAAHAKFINELYDTIKAPEDAEESDQQQGDQVFAVSLPDEVVVPGLQEPEKPIRVTKKSLRKEHPAPNLEVIQVPAVASFKKMVEDLPLIQRLQIQFDAKNDETHLNGLFQDTEKARSDLGPSTRANLDFRSPEKGLNKQSILDNAEALTDGTVKVKLIGRDSNNDKVTKTNENVAVSIPLVQDPDIGLDARVTQLFTRAWEFIEQGFVKLSQHNPETIRRVQEIVNRLRNGA